MKKGLKPGKRKRRQRHRPSDKDIAFIVGALASVTAIIQPSFWLDWPTFAANNSEEKKEKPVEVEFEIVEDKP